jgi:hypothetical protein
MWRPPADDARLDWGGDLWGDEAFFEAPHERPGESILVDAHIMATPALGDIDGDGVAELVVAASYFFDADYYADEVPLFPLIPQGWRGRTHGRCI